MLKFVTECRVCGSKDLTKYLDLGLLPLSNALCETSEEALSVTKYQLKVLFCQRCSLSQLSIVIDPEVMFRDYVYRSGISETYKNHCQELAEYLRDVLKINKKPFCVDIAGNDGTLLDKFRWILDTDKLLNVDPSRNLVPINLKKEIPLYVDFWSQKNAEDIHRFYGEADVITATNVFGHVDNIADFLAGINILLNRNGIFVLEFPYVVDMIENIEYDTIYFEHVSYFTLYSLVMALRKAQLHIVDIQRLAIHGGSLRVFISKKKSETGEDYFRLIERELLVGYDKITLYMRWAIKASKRISKFAYKIDQLRKEGKTVAAFAASAKGNVLLNCSGVKPDYIIDQTPEKIGKFSPGVGVEIVQLEYLNIVSHPDYIIILSWNFVEEIIIKCRKAGYKGKFITPVPDIKIF
jgi:hypothetical protein